MFFATGKYRFATTFQPVTLFQALLCTSSTLILSLQVQTHIQ